MVGQSFPHEIVDGGTHESVSSAGKGKRLQNAVCVAYLQHSTPKLETFLQISLLFAQRFGTILPTLRAGGHRAGPVPNT
jgi:hypothetical protein